MAAMTENSIHLEAMEPEVPVLEAATDTEATPGEVPEMSQAIEGEAGVEMDRREEQDGQAESLPIEDVSTSETAKQITWEVGARCRAVWSEDGKIYPATVVAVDGERCRVRFGSYSEEEDMELSALQSDPGETQSSQPQDWKPGSRCRAVYSVDGLVYPAVILWVKGQRCRVRYDDYNNEEELDVSGLLHRDELHGPSRTTKGGSWKSKPPSSNLDWKRGRRGESQGGRGGERRSTLREDPNSDRMKERNGQQNKVEKEKRNEDLTSNFFPSFAPPQIGSMDPLSFIPPPPPPPAWTFCGKEQGDVNAITNMLMLWYMCGFHTGSFMAQQGSTPSSKDKSHED